MTPSSRARPPALLLLLAVAGAALRQAAAARGLHQAPAAAAADGAASPAPASPPAASPIGPLSPLSESQYGSPRIDACIALTNSAGQACSVESDTLSLVYSRGSEKLPTPAETAQAIENMKAAAQPSTSCCTAFQPYSDSRCPCDAAYQQILPIGGFDPAYFEGATAILAQACGFDFPPCQPGEVAKPPPPAAGGRR